jgi:hypothetical protein
MIFNQISKEMGWPFTLVYLALILSAFYFAFISMPAALNAEDWPQTQGQVTHSELVQTKKTTKTGASINVFSAKIYYQYHIANHLYSAHEIKWVENNISGKIQQKMNDQYPAGSNVTVFYNPKKPSYAVLQKELSVGHILTSLYLLIGIGAMAFTLYQHARNRNK